MAAYGVEYSDRANGDVHSLSPEVGVRIARKILELNDNPHPRGDTIKRLQGYSKLLLRLRIGDYRAIFEVQESARRVVILRVVHRSQLARALGDMA